MPRFIDYDYQQTVMLPVVFDQQILPGTFEYSLNYLIDKKLDLSIFHHRFKNDDAGRPAYDPAILLKIVPCRRWETDQSSSRSRSRG